MSLCPRRMNQHSRPPLTCDILDSRVPGPCKVLVIILRHGVLTSHFMNTQKQIFIFSPSGSEYFHPWSWLQCFCWHLQGLTKLLPRFVHAPLSGKLRDLYISVAHCWQQWLCVQILLIRDKHLERLMGMQSMCLHTCTWWHVHSAEVCLAAPWLMVMTDLGIQKKTGSDLRWVHQGKWQGSSWILNNTARAGHSHSSHGSLECYRGVIRGVEWSPPHVWAMVNHGVHLHLIHPLSLSCVVFWEQERVYATLLSPQSFQMAPQLNSELEQLLALAYAGDHSGFPISPGCLSWYRGCKTSCILPSFLELAFSTCLIHGMQAGSKSLFQLPQNLRSRILIFCLHPRNITRWSCMF